MLMETRKSNDLLTEHETMERSHLYRRRLLHNDISIEMQSLRISKWRVFRLRTCCNYRQGRNDCSATLQR